MATAPSSRAQRVAAERAARLATSRLSRELNTIAAMLRIYCRAHHAPASRGERALCGECEALLAYARQRLGACVYGPGKPTCVNCPIHCYGHRQREAVRAVMRYAGPRMLWRHPWLAIAHLIDGRRPAPPRPLAGGTPTDPTPGAAAAAAATGPAPHAADGAPAPAEPSPRIPLPSDTS